jgi:hypothetical protein
MTHLCYCSEQKPKFPFLVNLYLYNSGADLKFATRGKFTRWLSRRSLLRAFCKCASLRFYDSLLLPPAHTPMSISMAFSTALIQCFNKEFYKSVIFMNAYTFCCAVYCAKERDLENYQYRNNFLLNIIPDSESRQLQRIISNLSLFHMSSL